MKRLFLTLIILAAGAVLFQGFQCSSPEMASAKIAYRDGDTLKAKAKLQELLRKAPNNGEAWIFLADIESKLKNFKEATEALGYAKKNMGAKVLPEQIAAVEASIWAGSYTKGFNYLEQFGENNDSKFIDTSIYYFNIASVVRPDNADIHRIIAVAYENKKDEEKALESYNKFVQAMKPSIDYAKAKGIYIGQPAREAVMKTGARPFDSRMLPLTKDDKDSLVYVGLKDDNNEIYLFLSDTKFDGKFIVKGWAVNQPSYLSNEEKANWRSIITNPYLALAEIYFKKKDYDKSMEYIMTVSAIEPFNISVNDYIVQIYQEQGKKEEALNVIKSIVDKNPNNSYYIQRYADILATFEKWDEAANYYEKAIKTAEPDSKDIPRAYQNLGVCYKNVAAGIYSRQRELADKNLKPMDKTEYEPFLMKSIDNYRKALGYEEQKENIDIMVDLFDIYFLVNLENDMKDIIKKIEAMETSVKSKDNDIQRIYFTCFNCFFTSNSNLLLGNNVMVKRIPS